MELTENINTILEFGEETQEECSTTGERNFVQQDRKLDNQVQIYNKHISISHQHPKTISEAGSNKVSLYSDLQDSDELRLLYLQPGSGGEMIKCIMKHAKFSEKPAFEALSYVWGPEDIVQPIVINECTIYVRQNLWLAMQHLRSNTETRVLWIDATCIDQQNIHERNHQVTQMGIIYNQATRVIVWLGLSDANSKLAFEILSSPAEWVDFLSTPSDHLDELEHDDKFKAISAIFNREYWTRVWIIQEFVLARDFILMCSHNICSGFRFSWFMELFESISHTPTRANEAIINEINHSVAARLCQLRKKNSDIERSGLERNFTKARSGYVPQTLYGIFLEYNTSKCVDQRDSVFGLHSLSKACCQKSIPIDYSLAWDVILERLVRHQYIFHCIPTGKKLHINTGVTAIQELLSKLISLFNTFRLDTSFSPNQLEWFSPPSTNEDREDIDENFNLISYVRGRIYYTSPLISHLDPFKDYLDIPELTPMIKRQLNYICSLNENRNSCHPYATAETDLATLHFNLGSSWTYTSEAISNLPPSYCIPYWGCNLHELNDDGDSESSLGNNFRQLLCNAQDSFSKTDFVLAFEENGLIFLTSNETKVGDLLCQFYGSDVLAVIPGGVIRPPYSSEIESVQRAVNFLASPHDMAPDICGKPMSFAKAKPYAIDFLASSKAMEQLCKLSEYRNGPQNIAELPKIANQKRKRSISSEEELVAPANKLACRQQEEVPSED